MIMSVFMKFIPVLLISVCIIFFSCGKKKDTTTTNNFEFIVNGISDVSIPAKGTALMGLSAEYKSGTQETVTFSISNLPAGVKDSFSSKSGTPTFGSFLVLTSDKADTSTTKITLNARSASGISKDYTFNLTVKPEPDCRTELAGVYSYTSTCNPGFTHNLTITVDPANPNRVLMTDFPAGDVYAVVNCDTRTFIIPKQIAGKTSYEAQGSGSFSTGQISIDYTHVPGPGKNCNISGTK
jgi:hypothetical protein